MGQVKNLDSQLLTASEPQSKSQVPESGSGGFLSGDFGFTARVSFRISSPWKVLKTWLIKIAS